MTSTYLVLIPDNEDAWLAASDEQRQVVYDAHRRFGDASVGTHGRSPGASVARARTSRRWPRSTDDPVCPRAAALRCTHPDDGSHPNNVRGCPLAERGHKVTAGAELTHSRGAKVVRTVDGALQVTDGPYAETVEQLSGFYLVESDDLDDLLECVGILTTDGESAVEIRKTGSL